MHDEAILECLKRIEHRLNSDEYEYSRFFTVGGITPVTPAFNSYQIRTPYNTECEWALFSTASFTNRSILAISSSNPNIAPPDLTAGPNQQFGLVSGGGDGNTFDGLILIIPANNGFAYRPTFQPLPSGNQIYVAISGGVASTPAYATFIFRRKLYREIPFPPTRKAHTHSTVQSRRGDRTFSEGFEAQYPHDKYIHETVPESQDTANIGNVENMTPAQKVLAKLRNGGR